MITVEYNNNQYRVQENGLIQRLQTTKNNGFTWVVLNPKSSGIEYIRVIRIAKGV
jgi:hypothetical protein